MDVWIRRDKWSEEDHSSYGRTTAKYRAANGAYPASSTTAGCSKSTCVHTSNISAGNYATE